MLYHSRSSKHAEQARTALNAQLQALPAAAVQAPAQAVETIVAQAENAAERIDIDEAATHTIIGAQLRACGWESC